MDSLGETTTAPSLNALRQSRGAIAGFHDLPNGRRTGIDLAGNPILNIVHFLA
jgi:hypothetical protein